jgi:sugar phosphate isomerase/epimerase
MGIIDVHKALTCCIDSFRRLCDMGVKHGVSILIENHGGLSAEADNIVALIDAVRMTHGENRHRHAAGFRQLARQRRPLCVAAEDPAFAKAVHAKVFDIDANLEHRKFDIEKCVSLAKACGYNGYLGIEYEGRDDPIEGVTRAVAKLTPLL